MQENGFWKIYDPEPIMGSNCKAGRDLENQLIQIHDFINEGV